MKVRELLTDESKWTKCGAFAIDSDGYPVEPKSDYAAKWCIYGGILKCYGMRGETEPREKLVDAIDSAPGPWNDHPSRTFSEVKALVEELDI